MVYYITELYINNNNNDNMNSLNQHFKRKEY